MRVNLSIYNDLISNIADGKTPQSKQYTSKSTPTIKLPIGFLLLLDFWASKGKRIVDLAYQTDNTNDLPVIGFSKSRRGYMLLFHIKPECQTDSTLYLQQMCIATIVLMCGDASLKEYNEFTHSSQLFGKYPDIKDFYYRLYKMLCS